MLFKSRERRLWAYGSNTVVSTVLFLGILGFVALIAERHPLRVDLTESGKFTLSEQTRNVFKSIDKPIHIKAFCATASAEQMKAQDLLDSYRYANQMITFEFVDPDRQPEIARQYEIKTYGTLVLEGYERKQSTQTIDEESVTNALFKLMRSEQKKICFLAGHGEHSIQDANKDGYASVKEALGKVNFSVAELNLLQRAQVPEDAAVVVVAGPQKPLMKQEIESLKAFLKKSGKLMVFVDPYRDAGLRDFLKSFGVQLSDDVIIDKLSRVFGGSYLMPVVMGYGHHKITDGFGIATFYPEARSIQPVKEMPQGINVTILASTSENAWGEKNLDLLKQGQAGFDEKEDMPGPVPVVAIADMNVQEMKSGASKDKSPSQKAQAKPEEEKDGKSPLKAHLLVAGDSDFVSNANFGLSGNGDFFLNMVNFLAEQETLITIEPRDKAGKPLLLSHGQASLMFWMVLVLVPLMVLVCGFAVYRVRRAQR